VVSEQWSGIEGSSLYLENESGVGGVGGAGGAGGVSRCAQLDGFTDAQAHGGKCEVREIEMRAHSSTLALECFCCVVWDECGRGMSELAGSSHLRRNTGTVERAVFVVWAHVSCGGRPGPIRRGVRGAGLRGKIRWCGAWRVSDRDRGSSHPLSPATPPDKRVRIRRFDELIPCRTAQRPEVQ